MTASTDSPLDPESGRVVDSDVLAERRARRAEQLQEQLRERARLAEHAVVELQQRLAEAEGDLAGGQRERSALAGQLELERARRTDLQAVVEAERARFAVELANAEEVLLAAVERGRATSEARLAELRRAVEGLSAKLAAAATEVDRRVAFERAARELVERELAAEREARAAEAAARSVDAGQLSARLAAAEVALAEARAGAAVDRARLVALETERAQRRAADDPEPISVHVREKSSAAVRAVLEAEIAERGRLEEQVRGALNALRGALEQARRERADRAARDAEVVGLVGHLVRTAHGLREGFQQELTALAAERDAQLAGERAAFAAELARETAERAAAEQRATDALEALSVELERLRVTDGGNPIYDTLTAGPLVPAADHPALLRPEAAPLADRAQPPAVVVDLARAAARLRAVNAPGLTLVEDGEPPRDIEDADAPQLADTTEPAPRGGIIPAALPVAPTTRSWFAPALATLAEVDTPTAERLLLAALAVQAQRVDKDVAYAIVLPLAGRHHVHVGRRGAVVVAPDGPGEHRDAEFLLEGTVEALAPLTAGGAKRRLPGVIVRGGRRRLRRLLRALRAPVGLAELRAAGARPRPGDLLALLCLGVPAEQVRGADFGVAYVVRDADGRQTRTLVRAEPDGSLTAVPEAPEGFSADATVTVDADGLLGVLAGSLPVSPAGDTQAVVTLQRWLRGAQGLPS